MGGNFKYQVQDSFLEYLFLKIWKTYRTFWKKPPLWSRHTVEMTESAKQVKFEKGSRLFY